MTSEDFKDLIARFKKKNSDPCNAQCPVCGYYCLGNGGIGCIDKPEMIKGQERNRNDD